MPRVRSTTREHDCQKWCHLLYPVKRRYTDYIITERWWLCTVRSNMPFSKLEYATAKVLPCGCIGKSREYTQQINCLVYIYRLRVACRYLPNFAVSKVSTILAAMAARRTTSRLLIAIHLRVCVYTSRARQLLFFSFNFDYKIYWLANHCDLSPNELSSKIGFCTEWIILSVGISFDVVFHWLSCRIVDMRALLSRRS